TAGSGSSTITTLSGTSDAAGQATFSVEDTVAESVTYSAHDTTDTVDLTPTATVQFVPGPVSASISTVSAAPTFVVADNSTTSTVTVTLKDANGNAVPGKAVSLAAGSGSSTITAISSTTDAAGRATFAVKDASVESVTYSAADTTDSNLAITQTAAVTFTVGAVSAGASTVTPSSSSLVADNSSTSTITVTLFDAYGHPVPGKSVTLTDGAGSSTITTVSGTTDASGHATFTVKDANVEDVTYTAHDTTDSVDPTQTPTAGFTVGPGPAAASTGGRG